MNVCAHWRLEQWEEYLDNRIPEAQRAEMENCLETCDACLHTFTRLVEKELTAAEWAQTADDFTERVMVAVAAQHAEANRAVAPKRNNRTRSTWQHYFIAASITLIFMGSGAFDAFAEGSRLNAAQHEAVSVAYQWNGHLWEKAKNWVQHWWTTSGRDTFEKSQE